MLIGVLKHLYKADNLLKSNQNENVNNDKTKNCGLEIIAKMSKKIKLLTLKTKFKNTKLTNENDDAKEMREFEDLSKIPDSTSLASDIKPNVSAERPQHTFSIGKTNLSDNISDSDCDGDDPDGLIGVNEIFPDDKSFNINVKESELNAMRSNSFSMNCATRISAIKTTQLKPISSVISTNLTKTDMKSTETLFQHPNYQNFKSSHPSEPMMKQEGIHIHIDYIAQYDSYLIIL
jgi:hypothetical protein